MPLTGEAADAFGVVTIVLLVICALLGLFCIVQSVYLSIRVRRVGFLSFFNGPALTRIGLVLLMFWWGIGEIFRSSIVAKKVFPAVEQQRSICNAYILSNMGFAEPSIFFIFTFLLRGSLQQKEMGALSSWWNRKTLFYSFLMCAPVFLAQSLLVFAGPMFVKENNSGRTKIAKYFIRTSYLVNGSRLCTYPLFGTIVLGLVDALVMSYVSYIGSKILLSVINKRLLRRVSWLMSAVLFLLPVRVVLLGFSVLPHPGDAAYQMLIFLSFLMMLSCMIIGISILVYCPVADSLAIGDAAQLDLVEMVPFSDYYDEAAGRSFCDVEMSSEVSTKRGSISFRTMVREDSPQRDGSFSYQGALHIGSPLRASPSSTKPMLPLKETPRN